MASEEQDLKETKEAVAKELDTMYSCMKMLGQDDIKHSGHKTVEDGIVWTFRNSEKRINKLWAEFLRKHPD